MLVYAKQDTRHKTVPKMEICLTLCLYLYAYSHICYTRHKTQDGV